MLRAANLTVSAAYALQLEPTRRRRATYHAWYVDAALAGAPADLPLKLQLTASDDVVAAFWQRILRTAWSIGFENVFKETMWRLSIDAVRHRGSRNDAGQRVTCDCGQGTCDRIHHFHTCPVAAAVYDAIAAAIPNCPPLERYHVWLAQPPTAALHPELWLVICMAALSAMDSGRRALFRIARAPAPAAADVHQTQITAFFTPLSPAATTNPAAPAPATPLSRACAHAVATFWRDLADFAALGLKAQSKRRQKAWTSSITPDHPIIGLQPDGSFVVHATA